VRCQDLACGWIEAKRLISRRIEPLSNFAQDPCGNLSQKQGRSLPPAGGARFGTRGGPFTGEQTRSGGVLQLFAAEPFHGINPKDDEEHEGTGLRDQEWRLRLGWCQSFERRDLLEELGDQNEEIEIEEHGGDHVNAAPSAGEAIDVAPGRQWPARSATRRQGYERAGVCGRGRRS
jgi:hypothetical protein